MGAISHKSYECKIKDCCCSWFSTLLHPGAWEKPGKYRKSHLNYWYWTGEKDMGVWRTQADTEGEKQRGRGRERSALNELLLGMYMPPGLDSPAQQKKTKKGKMSEKLL